MTDPMRQQVELQLENLEKERLKLKDFQGKMAKITGTGRSANRMVEAKVNEKGDLSELVFEGNRYRTLPPKELAALVIEAVREAQQDAKAQTSAATKELFPPHLADIFGMGDDNAKFDLDGVFDKALGRIDMSLLNEPQLNVNRDKKEF
jgi:DNA-binding protein YbaB